MNITTGKINSPVKAVMYGPEGIGKSTFAANWPSPLFVDAEKGTGHLDVARVPTPTSWTMLLGTLVELTQDCQGYKTLVLDTADWIDKIAQDHVCAKHKKESIEDFGYGRGWVVLSEEWKKFLDAINLLQERQGMHVLFLAHAQMRKFELPDEAGSYDRWELKTEKKSAAVLKEWSDVLLFANYQTIVVEIEKKKKAQGGERVIFTSHHPCWDAKNRYELKESFVLTKDMPKELLGIFADRTNEKAPEKKVAPAPVKKQETAPVAEAPKTETPKTEAPKPEARKEVIAPKSETLPPHLKKFDDIMQQAGVSLKDVQKAVAYKGYYPEDTPIGNYSVEFVNGCLIGAWDKVHAVINQLKKQNA